MEGSAKLPGTSRSNRTANDRDTDSTPSLSEEEKSNRLYERLKSMRQSVFSNPEEGKNEEGLFADMPPMETENASPTPAERKPVPEQRMQETTIASESEKEPKRATPPPSESTVASPTPTKAESEPSQVATESDASPSKSIPMTPAELTTGSQQSKHHLSTESPETLPSSPASEPQQIPSARDISSTPPPRESIAEDDNTPEKTAPSPRHPLRSDATPERIADSRSREGHSPEELLVTRESPILRVATMGPRQIIIGHESAYQVKVKNESSVAAEDVTLRIDLPVWTDIQGAEVSMGATNVTPGDDSSHIFYWKIGRLPGKGEELLVLHLVPRQSKPFDLKVEWDFRQSTSQAMIEVQEPRIEMFLEGPDEVLWGKEEVYRLHVKNAGTGKAQSVQLALAPIGSNDKLAATHTLEALNAGEEKVLEVAVTPRESGFLVINVEASAPHGLQSKTTKKVTVRRPELVVSVDAPPIEFVGSRLKYQIHVRNVGNAPASNVEIVAGIPLIAKYVSNSDNGRILPTKNQIIWQKDTLEPASEKTFTLTCELKREGTSALEVTGTADCGIRSIAHAAVNVQAIADLSLDVTDPPGPVAVGKDTEYLLTVTNRGTKGAEEIEIVAFFSRGIEPIHAEGGMCEITDGQVVFEKLPVLSAGQSITYKIRAKADQPGNHKFRAELICPTLETHLMGEETTYFYAATPGPKTPTKIASRKEGESQEEKDATQSPDSIPEKKPSEAPRAPGTTQPMQPPRPVPDHSLPESGEESETPARGSLQPQPAVPFQTKESR